MTEHDTPSTAREYKPRTRIIRDVYELYWLDRGKTPDEAFSEFDRWLAAHDAERDQRIAVLESRLRANTEIMNIAGIEFVDAEKKLAAHDEQKRAEVLAQVREGLEALPGSDATGYYSSYCDAGYREAEADALAVVDRLEGES